VSSGRRRNWLEHEDALIRALPRRPHGELRLLAERLGRTPGSVGARLKFLRSGARFASPFVEEPRRIAPRPLNPVLARPTWFENDDVERRLTAGR
jgi:hypothetical protein